MSCYAAGEENFFDSYESELVYQMHMKKGVYLL